MARKQLKALFEMPMISNGNQNLGKLTPEKRDIDEHRYQECQDSWTQIKTVDINDNLRIEMYRNGPRVRFFLLDSRDDIKGFFAGETNREPNLPPGFLQVIVTFIYKELQGNGYGTRFYEEALKLFGGIISDYELTDGSLGVWKNLIRKYPVYGLDNGVTINDKIIPLKAIDTSVTKGKNSPDKLVASVKPLKI